MMAKLRNLPPYAFIAIVAAAIVFGFVLGRWNREGISNGITSSVASPNAGIAPVPPRDDSRGLEEEQLALESEKITRPAAVRELAEIDFENLPTDQRGMDAVFTKIFQNTSPSVCKRLFAELLDHLESEQAPLLLKSFRLRGGLGIAGHEEYRWFWDRWADIDGRAATTLAFDIDGDDGYSATQITNSAIKAWARNDPEAAVTWLSEQDDIGLKRGMRGGLLQGIVEFYPGDALEFLEQIDPTPKERKRALSLVATRIAREQGPNELDSWLATLPEDTPDREAIADHVTRIHLDHGVQHAIEWASGDREMLPKVFDHFSEHDPERFFDYAATSVRGIEPDLEGALQKAAGNWVNDNPNVMGHWLRDNMNSPQYDVIAGIFVDSIRDIDGDAADAWEQTIGSR